MRKAFQRFAKITDDKIHPHFLLPQSSPFPSPYSFATNSHSVACIGQRKQLSWFEETGRVVQIMRKSVYEL